jgi:N6-adenosine-specific RNA methylase IME4
LQEEAPVKFEEIASGKTKMAAHLKERKIEVRKEKIAAQVEEIKNLPKIEANKEYGVIVIDPPWAGDYDPDGLRGAGDYPTMSFEEISSIKLPMAKDCVVWVWGVDLYLKETMDVISRLGLERKSTLIWVKDKFGLGHWLRNQHEYCFLCVRGNPMFDGKSTSTILNAPRGKHSEKPNEFYALVEKTCPDPRRLDYFARKKRDGWDVYGDEVK